MFRAIKATAVLSTTVLVGGALLPSVSAHVIVNDNFLCRDGIPWMLPATYCDSWNGTTGGGSGGANGGNTGGSGGTGYAYDPWWRDGYGGGTSGNTGDPYDPWWRDGDGGSTSGNSNSGWFGGGGSTGSGYTGNPWWRVGSGGTVGGSSDREWFGGGIGGSSSSGNGWFGGGEGSRSRDRSRNGNGEYNDETIGDDGYGGGGPLAWCNPTYTLETSWIRPKKRVVHITEPPFTRAALSIEQSTDLPQGIAGQSIHYTIRVHNLSDYYATDVIILDKILADLVCIEHAPLAYVGQRNLLWYIDFIAPHSSQLIQFRARIRPTVRRNTVVHNTVLAQTDGPHLRVIDVHDVGIVGK